MAINEQRATGGAASQKMSETSFGVEAASPKRPRTVAHKVTAHVDTRAAPVPKRETNRPNGTRRPAIPRTTSRAAMAAQTNDLRAPVGVGPSREARARAKKVRRRLIRLR